jgi:hypothetical protein
MVKNRFYQLRKEAAKLLQTSEQEMSRETLLNYLKDANAPEQH